jgi:predicted RNase H-like HicB family nuclease
MKLIMPKISFNARIEKSETGWYIGQIEEMPEVISQGKTIEELKDNLMDAFSLIIETRRETMADTSKGKKTIRRKLNFA